MRIAPSEQRVNERRDSGTLGEQDQPPENSHYRQEREQPELLAHAHEVPEFVQEFHRVTPLEHVAPSVGADITPKTIGVT